MRLMLVAAMAVGLTGLVQGCRQNGPVAPAAAPAAPQPPPPDPKLVAQGAQLFVDRTCTSCHGKDANTPILATYPKLTGQSQAYAEQQIRDIKAGLRNNGQSAAMKGILVLVSDEEIKPLAAYLAAGAPGAPAAGPPPGGYPPEADPALVKLGAKLFVDRTCVACHGADARTPTLPNYPKLGNQNAAYAEQQLRDIKAGTRNNGQTAVMKAVMPLVSDDDIKALAAYISSLKTN